MRSAVHRCGSVEASHRYGANAKRNKRESACGAKSFEFFLTFVDLSLLFCSFFPSHRVQLVQGDRCSYRLLLAGAAGDVSRRATSLPGVLVGATGTQQHETREREDNCLCFSTSFAHLFALFFSFLPAHALVRRGVHDSQRLQDSHAHQECRSRQEGGRFTGLQIHDQRHRQTNNTFVLHSHTQIPRGSSFASTVFFFPLTRRCFLWLLLLLSCSRSASGTSASPRIPPSP